MAEQTKLWTLMTQENLEEYHGYLRTYISQVLAGEENPALEDLEDVKSKLETLLGEHKDNPESIDDIINAALEEWAEVDSNGVIDKVKEIIAFLEGMDDSEETTLFDKLTELSAAIEDKIDEEKAQEIADQAKEDAIAAMTAALNDYVKKPTIATSGNVVVFSENGITDSGKTLGISVPEDAVFTDTTYTLTKTSATEQADMKLTFASSDEESNDIAIALADLGVKAIASEDIIKLFNGED